MKDLTKHYPNREYDELFYADDESLSVDRVQAFKCPPNDDNTRWVPEKGYSVSIGGRLFRSESGAHSKLREDAEKERKRLTSRINKIDLFLGAAVSK